MSNETIEPYLQGKTLIDEGINDLKNKNYQSARENFYKTIGVLESIETPLTDATDIEKKKFSAAFGQGLVEGIMVQENPLEGLSKLIFEGKDLYKSAPNAFDTPESITSHRLMGRSFIESGLKDSGIETLESMN